jgi:CheY-like chemotaxis protein
MGSIAVPRILVVDDEPLIALLFQDWLTELGCEVVGPASSVEDGLDLLGRAKLDGAILDIRLNGHDSYALAEALRARQVPFAFATGDGGQIAQTKFKNPILLQKPCDFEAMRTVLGRLLESQPSQA